MRIPARIAATLAVAVLSAAALPAQLQDLLNPAQGTDPQAGVRDRLRRSQVVTVNRQALFGVQPGDAVRLALFDDAVFTVRFDSVESNGLDGTTWRGHLEGRQNSLLLFSEVGGEITGSVTIATRLLPRPIAITPIDGGLHAVRELSYSPNPCGAARPVTVGAAPEGTSGCDTTVRILVVYGNGAANQAGGVSPLSVWVVNQMAYLNAVMANSNLGLRFEVANFRRLNWTSQNSMGTELTRLADPTDSYYDVVHSWRDQDEADLVSWIVGDHPSHRNVLGFAQRPNSLSTLNAANAFSVVEFDQGDHVFTHEIMHNLGCHHDPANISSGARLIHPYARARIDNQGSGLLITRFCTAVGYPDSSHPIIPYLSSPRISYRNSYGVFGNGPWLALGSSTQDNALSIASGQIWSTVANYRQTNRAPTITGDPQGITLCSGYRWGNAVFRVVASDATNYQWHKDGQELSGETGSSLSIDVEPDTVAGDYSCEVWNACGRSHSVMSGAATLAFDLECTNVRHRAPYSGADYGRAIANLGDFNGDGFDDLVIGAPDASNGAGYAEIRSGADGSILSLLDGLVGEELGTSVAAAGDINDDGFDDALIGAPGFGSDRGRVYTVLGGTPPGSANPIDGPNAGSRFGESVGRGDDVNGDGYLDFLIGAPGDSQLLIYSSRSRARLYRRVLTTTQGVTGTSAGDVNGDGFSDFLIGEPLFGGGDGRVTIVSGRTGSFLVDKRGSSRETLGWSVAGLGDVDGDGVPDYLAGSPGYDTSSNSDAGRAQVFSGATHARIRQHVGSEALGYLGFSVAAVGSDPRRGGAPDYVVGAPNERSTGGRAYLFRGSDGQQLRDWGGPSQAGLGASVAGLRDTGNPEANLAAGMPSQDPGGAVLIAQRGTANSAPAAVRFLGRPCRTSGGTVPHVMFDGRPAVGLTIGLGLQAAGAGAPASMWLDVADQNLPLVGFGAPGCTLHAFPGFSQFLTTSPQGTATVSLAIPNQPALVGAAMYAQYVLPDPAANSLGFVASDAVRFQFGAR